MRGKSWWMLACLGVLWGIPYLLIRVAVTDYHPVVVAWARAALGALVLLPFALRRGVWSGFGNLTWLMVYTLAEIGAPWVLIGYAERHVPSSWAGLIVALTPIIAAALGMAVAGERLGGCRILGLGLGLAGVAALLGLGGGPVQAGPILALGLSALGYALGPLIVARRLSGADPTAVVVASLLIATVIYAPFAARHWPDRITADATAAVVALALLCTALAFRLLFALVAEVGPARATIVAYINPAVATLLGVAVLDEPVFPGLIAGIGLILAGSVMATRGAASTPSGRRPRV